MSRLLPGDVVSCGYLVGGDPVTGTVIELKRRSDGAPFLMIQITSGPRKGQRVYPNAGWSLGVGDVEGACEVCGRQYRSTKTDAADTTRLPWCHRCAHLDDIQAARRSAAPERRSTSWERTYRRRLASSS